MQTRKRVLIVYFSLNGNTERVAAELAGRLGADLERLRERANRRGFFGHLRAVIDSLRERPALLDELGKRARDYELTIVGTPVWAGKITPAARACLESMRGEFGRVAFFCTSGATGIDRVLPSLEECAGLRASAAVGFTERELRDPTARSSKLDAFLATLSDGPAAPHETQEPAHALA